MKTFPNPRRRNSLRANVRLEELEGRLVMAAFFPLQSAADGAAGSLRDAIIQANSNGQDDVITLADGTYKLTLANPGGQENAAKTGDLDLTESGHSITIQGNGGNNTIIDGNGLDRVFQVLGNVSATLRNLSVRNGVAVDEGSPGIPIATPTARGGGILNAGNLTLDRVRVEGNFASGTSASSAFAGQDGASGKAAFGGGIANLGTLALDRSTVSINFAVGGKGGTGGDGTIFTRFTGGAGGDASGGGIWSSGSGVTISQSTVEFNRAFAGAGGAGGDNAKSLGGIGGFGGFAQGGGLTFDAGANVIAASTISDNTTVGGQGGPGGGGGNPSSSVPPKGTGADGGAGGSGGFGLGGGIANSAPLDLYQATISDNEAHGGSGGLGGVPGLGTVLGNQGATGSNGSARAGGLSTFASPALVSSIGTLIGDNVSDAPQPDMIGAFASASFTLLENATGTSGIADGVNGNIVGRDPMLGPLQHNGGDTDTRVPMAGSPAINAGANPRNLATDQRGFGPRAFGAAADIGAIETGASSGIIVKVVKLKGGRRQIVVSDSDSGATKFSVFPFGKGYRGNFQVQSRDVNGDGVPDVIASHGPFKVRANTKVFSGRDGTILPRKLV